MRNVPGVPRMWESVQANAPPSKDFYNPTSFMSISAREAVGKGLGKAADADVELSSIVTGHDRELLGLLPYLVFRRATSVLAAVWLVSAVYSVLTAFDALEGVQDLQLPWPWEENDLLREVEGTSLAGSSRIALLQGGLGVSSRTLTPERVNIQLPRGVSARSLSCDASGQHFAMIDGVSMFSAQMRTPGRQMRGGARKVHSSATSFMEFQEEACVPLMGQGLEDIAVVCGETCGALVLHGHGQRIATCTLAGESADSHVANISHAWLADELISSILTDPICQGSPDVFRPGCTSVGTSTGRVAQLQQRSRISLAPVEVFPRGAKKSEPGTIRAFNNHLVGRLTHQNTVDFLDTQQNGAYVGSLQLALSKSVGAFCTGGGYVYALTKDHRPEVYRFRIPEEFL